MDFFCWCWNQEQKSRHTGTKIFWTKVIFVINHLVFVALPELHLFLWLLIFKSFTTELLNSLATAIKYLWKLGGVLHTWKWSTFTAKIRNVLRSNKDVSCPKQHLKPVGLAQLSRPQAFFYLKLLVMSEWQWCPVQDSIFLMIFNDHLHCRKVKRFLHELLVC